MDEKGKMNTEEYEELIKEVKANSPYNLSFSCSLRISELLGLTWDCVDISEEAIEENRASN